MNVVYFFLLQPSLKPVTYIFSVYASQAFLAVVFFAVFFLGFVNLIILEYLHF